MRKVLIAFDGSDSSKRALQYVIDFARDHAATLEVHLLNVQHEPVLYGEYVTGEIIDQLQQSLIASADQALEWPSDQLKAAGISYKTHTALGNVAAQVSEFADQLG
jgi:nucleotide-binding universal stress UspA family protein